MLIKLNPTLRSNHSYSVHRAAKFSLHFIVPIAIEGTATE